MRQKLLMVGVLFAVLAGVAVVAVVFSWAPPWAWEIVIGVGLAGFLGDLWRRRLRSRMTLASEARRMAVALALVAACAALTGWATGVWTAGAFVATLAIGGVLRRRRSVSSPATGQ
jgi:hypothetical protein